MKNNSMATSDNPKADSLKRSLTIAGHRTSLSLEAEFWQALQNAAKQQDKSLASLVGDIDQARNGRNLSSAIRVWLFERRTTGG